MTDKVDRLLFIALILAVLFHGSALLYNVDKTYDAFVHIFFADHYARSWFDPWEPRWYTGFPTTSYPPLTHQLIGLLSYAGGLKFGFIIVIIFAVCFFIIGTYRFAQLWVPKRSAGYAAIFALVASSIVQTVHIYGQLPTMFGISCLTNVLPEIYSYFRSEQKKYLFPSLAILGSTVASHHVTTIFGMVFFIAPVVATSLLDEVGVKGKFYKIAKDVVMLGLKKWKLFLIFFPAAVFEIVGIIFPYWYWSKTDPITQVSIPHGSRDSFIEVTSSGLMFFLIPMGFTLFMLPFIFKSLYKRRNIFLAMSFSMLLLLGTGGTTPIPKILLGSNAFNILTLDRFTFWATVIAIPFVGDFFKRLIEGDIRDRILDRYSKKIYYILSIIIVGVVVFQALFCANFHKYKSLQPATVEVEPILQFLDRDQHKRWRFMTLGFGDQMAWLSSNTDGMSIDGNYHSARRVPEMTTQPLERLENSKFKGVQGIGSLQQFLTIPEKYFLKYIFSIDKFYDPILYFAGWERVQRLENGVMIWQKHDVPPLPSVLPRKNMPTIMRYMWGVFPLTALFSMFTMIFINRKRYLFFPFKEIQNDAFVPSKNNRWLFIWFLVLLSIISYFTIKTLTFSYQKDPETLLKEYYHTMDFKLFKEAHSYFPKNSIGYEDYILKLSVKDGLLASYGKLDSIVINYYDKRKDTVKAEVTTFWVTPLELYKQVAKHTLTRTDGKWYIEAPVFNNSLAPDEHMEKGILGLHSQGKRKITTASTEHDDVLDRPESFVISSSLVKVDSSYIVVGEIQNIDHLPSHVTIEAQLYDKQGKKLVSYNSKYTTLHKLLPKEIVPFRIEFEETAWLKNEDKNPMKFNPKEFASYGFETEPTQFKILARAVVADRDIYRDVNVQNIKVNKGKIYGTVFNFGTEEISVPQVLFTYYNKDREVSWVDHKFMRDGIRQQGIQNFEVPIPKNIKLIKQGTYEDFYINGLAQRSMIDHFQTVNRFDFIPIDKNNNSVRMSINSYIGNPTVY